MNFEYNNIEIPGCTFKISPSQISKFFESPVMWYKEQVLKEEHFKGNTSTVLGTIIHAFAEAYSLGEESSREEAEEFLRKFVLTRNTSDDPIDQQTIKELYPDMAMALINEYLRHNPATAVEEVVHTQVLDDIHVGGSVDNRTDSTVVDYKTATTKPKTDKIPFHYLIQLLAYAYCYRANGIHIDRLRLVYTVRPTKTLPIRVFVVNHVISDDDWTLIEDTLQLIAETIKTVRSNPELTHLLFKSMNLKES